MSEDGMPRVLFAILQMYEFSSKSQQVGLNFVYYAVVCDTANVRVFKQITTEKGDIVEYPKLFAILQMYEFSSKSQPDQLFGGCYFVVCDTANVRVFKQITTPEIRHKHVNALFAILQMYEFSSKSQLAQLSLNYLDGCLRYCKCTSFQANHNLNCPKVCRDFVVCDTANVRVFKQITTCRATQHLCNGCLRYCKCTSFQANHNRYL